MKPILTTMGGVYPHGSLAKPVTLSMIGLDLVGKLEFDVTAYTVDMLLMKSHVKILGINEELPRVEYCNVAVTRGLKLEFREKGWRFESCSSFRMDDSSEGYDLRRYTATLVCDERKIELGNVVAQDVADFVDLVNEHIASN